MLDTVISKDIYNESIKNLKSPKIICPDIQAELQQMENENTIPSFNYSDRLLYLIQSLPFAELNEALASRRSRY